MGNSSSSIKKISFEDVQHVINTSEDFYLLINSNIR